MKNKKILMIFCLLAVFLISFNIGSAASNNTTDNKNGFNTPKTVKSIPTTDKQLKKIVTNKFKEVKRDSSEDNNEIKSNPYGIDNQTTANISSKKTSDKKYKFTANVTNSQNKKVRNQTAYFVIDDGLDLIPVNITKGKTSTKYAFENYGTHTVTLKNDDYELISSNITINAQPVIINITAPQHIDITKNLTIKTQITDDGELVKCGNVSLYINNTLYDTITPKKGKTKFNLGQLEVGTHKIKIKYNTEYNKVFTSMVKVNVTRKYESIKVKIPKNLKTENKTQLLFTIKNGTQRLNTGMLNIKLNKKQIAYKRVRNGSVVIKYRMPRKADKYNITAYYINGKTVTNLTKPIKVYNSEILKFNPKSEVKILSKYSFKVKVKGINGKVNHGRIRLYVDGRTISEKKVRNGSAIIKYKMPLSDEYLNVTAEYLKYNKTVNKTTKEVHVLYVRKIIVSYLLNMTSKSDKSEYVSNNYDYVRLPGRLGQVNGYACAPHSLRQNLHKLGINDYSEWDLYSIMGTNSDGTGHQGINKAIEYVAEHSNVNLTYHWINFTDLGKTTSERFKNLGRLISKNNMGCFVHELYRGRWGHYEVIKSINTKKGTVTVLNSLGSRYGYGYRGYVETRSYDTMSYYIKNTYQGQLSVCVLLKK